VTQYTDPDDIKPVNIDNWLIIACQIWPDKPREFAHDTSFARGGFNGWPLMQWFMRPLEDWALEAPG